MSVVLATREFMLGDRRVSSDTGERCLPHLKVFRNATLVAGAVGNLSAVIAIMEALKVGASSPIDLVGALDDESEALCLQGGRMYLVGIAGVIQAPAKAYAIGTGADAALGYLAGSKDYTEASCRRAIRFAFTRRADCGDGIRLIRG